MLFSCIHHLHLIVFLFRIAFNVNYFFIYRKCYHSYSTRNSMQGFANTRCGKTYRRHSTADGAGVYTIECRNEEMQVKWSEMKWVNVKNKLNWLEYLAERRRRLKSEKNDMYCIVIFIATETYIKMPLNKKNFPFIHFICFCTVSNTFDITEL